jgi:hypothetical protein
MEVSCIWLVLLAISHAALPCDQIVNRFVAAALPGDRWCDLAHESETGSEGLLLRRLVAG